MKTLGIYMTSANRADKLITIKHMNKVVQSMTTIVCPYDQWEQYEAALVGTEVKLLAAPKGVDLMGPKRQWAIEIAEEDFFWMMDDDLDFFIRDKQLKLHKATPDQVNHMILDVWHQLEKGVPFVGVSCRLGNNRVEEDHKDIGRVSRCWAFDRKIYNKLGINVAPFPEYVIDDFHIILTFLENGHKNRILFNYAQEDKGSNSAGGCSVYRNYEVQKKSAHWLAKQHPKSVEVVTKNTKTSWVGMKKEVDGSNTRVDVRVQWFRAFVPVIVPKRSFFKP